MYKELTNCGFGDKDELTGSFVQNFGLKGKNEFFS